MKRKILVVEDEEKITNVLVEYLDRAGYATGSLADGREVVPRVQRWVPDLILLDVMLPSRDGFELCSEIRAFSDVPIIMITSRTEETDRLRGLGLGADDYICKPFSANEVVARVRGVLRRVWGGQEPSVMALTVNEELFQAALYGHKLGLTPAEFKLLQILSSRPGRVYSRAQLLDMLFLDEHCSCDRTIDNHVKNLRKKLTAIAPEQSFIHSIYGVGYKFEGPLQPTQ